MSRARSYCFTLNNYSEDEYTAVTELDVNYLVVGREIGESGTPHLQGYVNWHNAKSLPACRKLIPRAHWEITKGSPLQASDYCKKEEIFFEKGELPEPGKRNDILVVREQVQNGASMRDIVEVATSFQSIRIAEVMLKYYEKPRTWEPIVKWYWGPTGTGKSRRAYKEMPDAYTCMSTGRWFEGYDAHENVIIDDMRGDFLKFHELLRLLDRYEFRIECKGGSRQFVAKNIIITSCYPPEKLFETREDIGQLLRRLTVIKEFKNK